MHSDDFNHEVFDSIFNSGNDDELRVVAEQIVREVQSGSSIEDSLTASQYQLGLDVAEVRKVEAFVQAAVEQSKWASAWTAYQKKKTAGGACIRCHQPLPASQSGGMCNGCYAKDKGGTPTRDIEAGLKTTLRSLRRQLNKADTEDLDGINKLLSAIQGLEKQLEQKDKARDERRKKKESAEPKSDEPKDATADAESLKPDLKQDLKPRPDSPSDSMPPDPNAFEETPVSPLPNAPTMMQTQIDLFEKKKRLETKLGAIRERMEKRLQIPELEQKSLREKPILFAYMQTVEGARLLLEQAGQKYQMLLTAEATYPKPEMLKRLEERMKEALDKGESWAEKALSVLRGFKGQPELWTNRAPSLQFKETPKTLQKTPHMQLEKPEQKTTGASFNLLAEGDMSDALDETLGHILEALSDAAEQFSTLVDIVEMQTA